MINIEGDTATLVFTIKQPVITAGEVSGYTLTDPFTLSVAVTDPAAAETTYVFGTDNELTKLEIGVYRLTVPVPIAGLWGVAITATDPAVYDEQSFQVGESQDWEVVPPLSDYEMFRGDPASEYSAMALDQAQLLLQLAAGEVASTRPTDPTDLRVYRFGIFAMAEALENNRATRSMSLSPFRVEEIGSYRYEKARQDVRRGIPTGILWFDMAVDHFIGQCPLVGSMHSSIRMFDFEDGLRSLDQDGRDRILGPAEVPSLHLDQYRLMKVYGFQFGVD